MRSIMAVGIGVLLALALGLLVVQGIFAPIFTRFFGLERTGPAALPVVLLVFAAGLSFYFGGMAASYKGPPPPRPPGPAGLPSGFRLSAGPHPPTGEGF